ncbi:MAG: GntR family transcriptional regulator [Chloroflexi bacterium]|nr:GntR family transcriptional regulator [Chloroflexota bacterium]
MTLELPVRLDEHAGLPLHRQLYDQLRIAILEGRLAGGSRMPSTRALANQLGLSRNTVTSTYDQLLAEGYITARLGSGTYVCTAPPDDLFEAPRHITDFQSPPRNLATTAMPPLSDWARRATEGKVDEMLPPGTATLPYDFRDGRPAIDHFPTDLWRRLLGRRLRSKNLAHFGYAPTNGVEALRQALTEYLRRARAVRCTPEQILIVNGSQQALDLLARVCLNPGDAVVLEEPGYLGARRAFTAQGARIVHATVDAAGLITEELDRMVAGASPKLLYVTPSHQFPTGAVLSLPRRLALLRWAREHGALVIEDDYDSEFRYAGRPVEALQGLDTSGTVVYIGTFSKVLFPSLRMGYLVLPPSLVEPVNTAKWLSDRYTATLEQQVLADFFNEGHFERHLRAMRQVYQTRHDAFVAAIDRELGDLVLPPMTGTGLHALVTLREPLPIETLVRRAAREGVGIYPAQPYYLNPPPETSLVMGYTGLNEQMIAEGMRRLGTVIRATMRETARTASAGA